MKAGGEDCINRVIAHVDLDAFYAQVEMVRLELDESIPLCVQQWGGVIAVNYAARSRGISRMDNAEDVKRKCPECKLVHVELIDNGETTVEDKKMVSKVSLERYRAASARIFKVITGFAERVERIGLDEAFLDITELVEKRLKHGFRWDSSERRPDTIIVGDKIDPSRSDDLALLLGSEIVNELRQAIRKQLSYTCSAGIAHNKTLAKLGSTMNKPNGQAIVPRVAVPEFMEKLPFKRIRHLGGKLGSELKALGIETAGQAQCYSIEDLEQRFGAKSGNFIYNAVRGIDNSEVILRSKSKSMLAAKQLPAEYDWAGVEKWFKVLASELHDRMTFDEEVNEREARSIVISYKSASIPRTTSKTLAMPRDKKNRVDRMLAEILSLLKHTDSFTFPITFLGLTATNFEEKQPSSETIDKFFTRGADAQIRPPEVKPNPPQPIKPSIKRFFSAAPTGSSLSGSLSRAEKNTEADIDSSDTPGHEISDFELARRLQEEEDRLHAREQAALETNKKRKLGTIDSYFLR